MRVTVTKINSYSTKKNGIRMIYGDIWMICEGYPDDLWRRSG